MRHSRMALAVSALVAATAIGACSEQDENPTNKAPRVYDTVTTSRIAVATGTVRYAPMLHVRDMPVGSMIQSAYSRTTERNAEYRRGMIEFAGSPGDDTVDKAVLAITPGSGWSGYPQEPDRHILSWYRSNQRVDSADFDRRTTEIGSFLTDVNDTARPTLYFDVTSAVRAGGAGGVGFRIQIEGDDELKFGETGGIDFQDHPTANPPQLLFTTIRVR